MIRNLFLLVFIHFLACSPRKEGVHKELWGEVKSKDIYLYTLTNRKGMVLKVTNYGGIITNVYVPDMDGNFEDVVLGFDNLKQYVDLNSSMGAIVGRFANRIKDGTFKIDDQIYNLTKNNDGNTLHGGGEFATAVWEGKIIRDKQGNGLRLLYKSEDGQHGFPGNLDVIVTYTLTENNAIQVRFEAETDKKTHINLTQHSYFNLNGVKDLIYDHLIRLDADLYTEFDDQVVPTGKLDSLKGKTWDLSEMTRIGDKIHDIPLNGYHHCYVLNKPDGVLKKMAEVIEPKSGRTLEVSTTQPGIVLYASNVLSTEITGKYDIQYGPHMAFCIETQHFPDAPNHPNFPSTLLWPDKKYEEIVIYKFGVVPKS